MPSPLLRGRVQKKEHIFQRYQFLLRHLTVEEDTFPHAKEYCYRNEGVVDRNTARDGPERCPVLIVRDVASNRVSSTRLSLFNAGATQGNPAPERRDPA